MPFRWPSIRHDIALAKEVAASAPDKPAEWDNLAVRLAYAFTTEESVVELKGRGCRERMGRLLEKYKQDDAKALKRHGSGTEEDFTELHQLCEDILTYRRDMNELKVREKEEKRKKAEDKRRGEEMRRAALEGLKKRCPSNKTDSLLYSSEEDSDDNNLETTFEDPQTKMKDKKKKSNRKRASKLSVAEVLETKYKKKAELQEKELEIRKQELDLQREKIQAETEERRSRFELEMEERRMMLELLKEKFKTN